MPNQLKLPTDPLELLASMTTLTPGGPADSAMPVLVTVVHVCQPPVFGTAMDPVLFTPSTSMWNEPPVPLHATRTSNAYVPAAAKVTVYLSHSPALTQARL